MAEQQLSPANQKIVEQGKAAMGQPGFHIPDTAKVAIGLGAAIVGAFTAYQATQEGLDTTEDYVNKLGAKIKNRKNAQSISD